MKILIIHTAFIGDIILSTPFIKKIKTNYKNCKIDYLTTPMGAAVLKNNPLLEKIIVYDKKGKDSGIKGFLKIIKKIKEEKYDIAFIPHRYLRSSLLAFLGNVKERIGYNISSGKIFLNHKVMYDKNAHEVDRILNLIEDVMFKDKKIELYPGVEEIDRVNKMWNDYKIKQDEILIAIAPGSKWKTKMWPIEYYNELIKKIGKLENIKMIIIGGKEEEKLDIFKSPKVVNLIGKTTLLDTAEILKRSKILISNDSSPIHIASAFDTYIFAIFGATIKGLGFYPWSKNSEIIENISLDCRPCGLHGGNECPKKHFKCMLDVSPDKVYDKIIKVLEKVKE